MSRRILNPTRSFTKGCTKVYVDIDEPGAPGLRQRAHQDWKLRIWKEVEETNKNDGVVVFFTATYDEENLPRFRYTDGNIKVDIPSFDKSHYVKFMSDLRGYFYRRYAIAGPGCKSVSNKAGMPIVHASRNIRVMWPCEYGMDSSKSERPHYHPLLFFPQEYRQCPEFKSESLVKKLISSLWPYGFCIYSKQSSGGIFVKKDFVATYVSKYCFKQTQYYTREDVRNFLFDDNGERIASHFKAMKGKLPTHWQSNFFGIGLINDFSSYESYRDGVSFGFEGFTKTGEKLNSSMPLYIQRKVMYKLDDSRSYRLTPLGVQWKLKKLQDKLDEKVQNLRYVYFDNLEKYVDSVELNRLFGHQGIISHAGLRHYIRKVLAGRDLQELVLYNTVWKGVHCQSVSDLQYIEDLSLDEFRIESFTQYLNTLSPPGEDAYNPDGYFKEIRRRYKSIDSVNTFSDALRFDGFEELNSIYEKVYNSYRAKCDKKYLDDLMNRKKLKFAVS